MNRSNDRYGATFGFSKDHNYQGMRERKLRFSRTKAVHRSGSTYGYTGYLLTYALTSLMRILLRGLSLVLEVAGRKVLKFELSAAKELSFFT